MKLWILLVAVVLLVLLSFLGPPAAHDCPAPISLVTQDGRVIPPGEALPAGFYVVRVVELEDGLLVYRQVWMERAEAPPNDRASATSFQLRDSTEGSR